MPKPGPRPYECVRRAWHSERHQPIRGSLIQEIFRIAYEIHGPSTKKNKEWQQKLPIVVLKAEEILYSKANSEAEYMDLKTLSERANEAINIIIRRGEGSEETGELLQPCIEAALHLGCIPRRASRSQRNNQPIGYLTGNMGLMCATGGNPRTTTSLAPTYSNLLRKEPRNFVAPTNNCVTSEIPFLSCQSCLPTNGSFPLKASPVYPLHYGGYPQPAESQPKLGYLGTSKLIGDDSFDMGIPQKLPLYNEEGSLCMRDASKAPNNLPNDECDLSLRLGFAAMQEDVGAGPKHPREKINVVNSWQGLNGGLTL